MFLRQNEVKLFFGSYHTLWWIIHSEYWTHQTATKDINESELSGTKRTQCLRDIKHDGTSISTNIPHLMLIATIGTSKPLYFRPLTWNGCILLIIWIQWKGWNDSSVLRISDGYSYAFKQWQFIRFVWPPVGFRKREEDCLYSLCCV